MKVVFLGLLQNNPATAAKRALELFGPVDQLVEHFDVDVIDFSECPLAENHHHGEGCTLEQATMGSVDNRRTSAFTGVTVAQLNPRSRQDRASHAHTVLQSWLYRNKGTECTTRKVASI